jgi:UDP-N-acetylmuramate: L-alanyl-gamma-D-glutamyl-meso-diaminopimelate ligase
MGARAHCFDDLLVLQEAVVVEARSGDVILVMSNGGFGGIHQKILDALALKFA